MVVLFSKSWGLLVSASSCALTHKTLTTHTKQKNNNKTKKIPKISTAKAAAELGLTEYIPLERSVLEMAADVLARPGMVPAWRWPRVTPLLLFYAVVFSLLLTAASRALARAF